MTVDSLMGEGRTFRVFPPVVDARQEAQCEAGAFALEPAGTRLE